MQIPSRNLSIVLVVLLGLFFYHNHCLAQPDTAFISQRSSSASSSDTAHASFPVIFMGDTLLSIHSNLGPYQANERASQIGERLDVLYRNIKVPLDSVRIIQTEATANIGIDEEVLLAVSADDAALSNKGRNELAQEYLEIIRSAFTTQQEREKSKSLILQIALAAAALLAAIAFFWGMRKVFPKVYSFIETQEGRLLKPIRLFSQELISAEGLSAFALFIFKILRLATSLVILYFFITITLDIFPVTRSWNVTPVLNGLLLTLGVTVFAIIITKALHSIFDSLSANIPSWKGSIIQPIKFRTVEILSEQRIVDMTKGGLSILRAAINVVLGYFYITIVFSFFVWTENWASTLIGYIMRPLASAGAAMLAYIPNIFYIAIILSLAYYINKLIGLFFDELRKGTFTLPGFYPEWAPPTFKIVRFFLFALTAVVVFPYLPGSDSPAFQGVSVFLGILFSLGSTSAIGNMVAGIVLTYMRPFRVGDRVKIADAVGDIVERTILVTRLRTVKNVDITIPNAMVLGSHIVNFTSSAKDRGLILHTKVTIGYDVPWNKVHTLLTSAAKETESILKEPEPFVLQTSLDDFYVSYELNAYTDNPAIMARTYSRLHENIQNNFFTAGVEILSPHYSAVRDGHESAIPQDYLPKDYSPPSFRISFDKLLGRSDQHKSE